MVFGPISSCGVDSVVLRQMGSQFPDQGSNLGPLHWKVDFSPLDHQGSPSEFFCE